MVQEMARQLLIPHVVGCNVAISACEKGKLWEHSLGLLQRMMHHLLTLSVLSCNTAISACEKGKQ